MHFYTQVSQFNIYYIWKDLQCSIWIRKSHPEFTAQILTSNDHWNQTIIRLKTAENQCPTMVKNQSSTMLENQNGGKPASDKGGKPVSDNGGKQVSDNNQSI